MTQPICGREHRRVSFYISKCLRVWAQGSSGNPWISWFIQEKKTNKEKILRLWLGTEMRKPVSIRGTFWTQGSPDRVVWALRIECCRNRLEEQMYTREFWNMVHGHYKWHQRVTLSTGDTSVQNTALPWHWEIVFIMEGQVSRNWDA